MKLVLCNMHPYIQNRSLIAFALRNCMLHGNGTQNVGFEYAWTCIYLVNVFYFTSLL